MNKKSEAKKLWWANLKPEERSKLMSERKRKGDADRDPAKRKIHAAKALEKRWPKKNGLLPMS